MTEGFFTKKEVESKSRPDGKTYSCASCGLHRHCKSPRMKPYGKFKKGILNIGEAPGEVEDYTGRPWQGRTGKLLQRTYRKLGIDLFQDCLNINTVNCRPSDPIGHNRTPTNYEVECCRRSVVNVINTYKPKVIVLFGNQAVFSLIGHRWKKDLGGITKWRGWTIPDQDFQTWICPTFHPSYVERADKDGFNKTVEYTIWKQDLKQAIGLLEEGEYQGKKYLLHLFPILKEPKIEFITDLSILDKIKSGEIAFDYETTGIKPQAEGHKIVCCSIADSPDHCYVFMMPKTREELKPFIRLLKSKRGKIAQNMKYEHAWTKKLLHVTVRNWVWDTMIYTHVMDNRQSITGLKFQVYVQFGVVDYASDVSQYLESSDKETGSNSINNIDKLLKRAGGKKLLMTYCGYDSIYEYRLAEKQRMNILPF